MRVRVVVYSVKAWWLGVLMKEDARVLVWLGGDRMG